jgi:hypothetical protein
MTPHFRPVWLTAPRRPSLIWMVIWMIGRRWQKRATKVNAPPYRGYRAGQRTGIPFEAMDACRLNRLSLARA